MGDISDKHPNAANEPLRIFEFTRLMFSRLKQSSSSHTGPPTCAKSVAELIRLFSFQQPLREGGRKRGQDLGVLPGITS